MGNAELVSRCVVSRDHNAMRVQRAPCDHFRSGPHRKVFHSPGLVSDDAPVVLFTPSRE